MCAECVSPSLWMCVVHMCDVISGQLSEVTFLFLPLYTQVLEIKLRPPSLCGKDPYALSHLHGSGFCFYLVGGGGAVIVCFLFWQSLSM